NTPVASTSTSTSTRTAVPATSTLTRTNTPNVTATPCTDCDVKFKKPSPQQEDVDLTCNPDGTLHWTANLTNKPDHDDDPGCTLTVPFRASLQIKCQDNTPCSAQYGHDWLTVRVQYGSATLPPRQLVTRQGDFCFHFLSGTQNVHYEFALDSTRHDCDKRKK